MTPRKIEANRRNAKRSSGPRTEGGKRISRFNAVTLGLFAHVVIPICDGVILGEFEYSAQESFDMLQSSFLKRFAIPVLVRGRDLTQPRIDGSRLHVFQQGTADTLALSTMRVPHIRVPLGCSCPFVGFDKVQAILRHADVGTTMTYYVKSLSEDSVRAMAALDNILCSTCALDSSVTVDMQTQ